MGAINVGLQSNGADPCAKPVQIPAGWLSDQQIEVFWGRDRQELLKCGDKVDPLSGRAVE
ncbi:hypothetical protein MED193_08423 [Roseobacter sp. MED193]|nr:hypothetical protein MED193_08423 [Roseobacter sp. MED193]